MTNRVLVPLFLLALLVPAACGGSSGSGEAADTTPASGEEPAAASEEPAAAAEEPVAAPPAEPASCKQEVALQCADGFADGCLSKLTTKHACVADSEKKAGPPACKMEIARTCPDGQVDACSTKPRMAKTHVCVVAPK